MTRSRVNKVIVFLSCWLASYLKRIASWLENIRSSTKKSSEFVDLAPTDEADKEGIYSKAILFALSKPEVFNIALTGPYGSGKSSVIQTFLKKHSLPALQISLAAFVPEADQKPEINSEVKEVSRQEIERSILQQMLYGAEANKLPLSRFKRIQSPGFWSFLTSFYILIGTLAFWYVFQQREDLISGDFFTPLARDNWLNLGSAALVMIFLWSVVHYFHIASFGLSLKSLSLKDVEIKPVSDDHASILNRHLDEIIYFFQSTRYELVIIEDLDRFNNPDVFLTLREINRLVNKNAGVKRTVRFIYALRDDMFVNTERTKFFEFIIPVIPIINTSNSIDMVLEQGKRLELDERFDKQFLREVSRYLNDLRLIQNIFNEYTVYMNNLEVDGEGLLDANKLLAVLIYKNIYPRDFEQLHQNKGGLAKILKCQGELIKNSEAKYRSEIAEIERQLEVAEKQAPVDLKELRQVYAMALIEEFLINDGNVIFMLEQGVRIELSKLVNRDEFDQVINASSISYRGSAGQRRIDISSLQNIVNPQKSYEQRKVEIERKSTDNKSKKLQKINELRAKIATLRTTKLDKLLRLNAESTQELFKTFGEGGELARFLILEGYLDDTYYQYTSLFHAGRLSPNDNKFLIQIRAYVTPEPNFPIDNPKEVIAAMREEDFRQSYVLNVKIVDCLLSDKIHYSAQLKKLLEFIASEFESCEEFFDDYYINGHDVKGLLSELVMAWKNFIPNAIASSKNTTHITKLVTSLPINTLENIAETFKEFPELVAEQLLEILDNAPELEAERLKCLGFLVKDLTKIKGHSEIVRAIFEGMRFELTATNLEYIYQELLGKTDLHAFRESNFTILRSINNPILMKRIDNEFDTYLSNVLVALPENSKEGVAAILAIVNHEKLEQEQLRAFLERQTNKLPNFDDVPEKLYSILLELNAVEPTWNNCLAFMESDEFQKEALTGYLDKDEVRLEILKQPLSSDTSFSSLCQFLFNAESMSDEAYGKYAHILPSAFNSFPKEFQLSKLKILIHEEKVVFNKDNLDYLSESKELQLLFVAKNVDAYLTDPNCFELGDDFRELLLMAEINDTAKFKLIEFMNLEMLSDLPERAALIGSVLVRTTDKLASLSGTAAQAIVLHSKPITIQIVLLNKYHQFMTKEEVYSVLAKLEKPYSEINIGYKVPRLKNIYENKSLVKWLDERNMISSWSYNKDILSEDIKVYLYRS